MNLYEFEGKDLFAKHNIAIPDGVNILRGDDIAAALSAFDCRDVVVKAQILSGKRGKNGGITFCTNKEDAIAAVEELFALEIRGQHVAAVRVEEKLDIAEEHYLSITYDTISQQPMVIYSKDGGVDIEDVPQDKIEKHQLDIRSEQISGINIPYVQELWDAFRVGDARLVEINPLVKTADAKWIAADAKVALDDDAFYRHTAEKSKDGFVWEDLMPRTDMGRPPTDREVAVKNIDAGEGYYRGTAGKYIEMDGDIAMILNGGGASIANMDALLNVGLKPANYTEYSGNPPREKVYELAKIIMSKPGIRGLWACGVVANFTNVKETFQGFADALDEIKPTYPIVVRRDGPEGEAGRQLLQECADRNGLNMKIFGKDTSMTDTAATLALMINNV